MNTSFTRRLSARVTGRVQGVGFRHFTRTRAKDHDLRGWVRNESDGSVRVEAEGPRDALDALLEALHEGPGAARVEEVAAEWSESDGAFDDFRVQR